MAGQPQRRGPSAANAACASHRRQGVIPPDGASLKDPVPVMDEAADTRARRLRAERSELIGWLAGAVAHDVNNVLAAIAGYAELIEADLDAGDPHLADTAGIRDAVQRAGGLVRHLLTVGRRQTLRLEVLDASDIVEGLIPLLGSACGDRVRVVPRVCTERAAVNADRSLLEQALLTLAVNARDAMPDGGTLTVTVAVGPAAAGAQAGAVAGDAPPDEVRISVEDTGVGIDDAALPHVFEPFFTTKDRGSGFGLASVGEAVARCGGAVSVESRAGTGSRFTLHLPQADAAPTDRPAPRVGKRVRGGTETILVVDADPEVRLVLARLLHGLGYDVVDAATPGQAIALAEYAIDRVDLLVTEVALPDLPGPQLAARIRTVHPSVRVLFLSRAARGQAPAQLDAPPGSRVLAKPFTAERLGSTLRAMLDARVPNQVER